MSTRKDQLLRRMSGKKGRAVALTREEKALRDVAELLEKGAGGGLSVQPDLSQNDPNAADYVKNRTHYGDRYTWESEHTVAPLGQQTQIKITKVPYVLGEKIYIHKDDGSLGVYTKEIGVNKLVSNMNGLMLYLLVEETDEADRYDVTVTFDNQFLNSTWSKDIEDAYISHDHDSLKTLDEKYIPDTIARVEDIANAITGAMEASY